MKHLIIGTAVTGACKFAGSKLLAMSAGINSACGSVPVVGKLVGAVAGAPFKLLGTALNFIGFLFYIFAAALILVLLFKIFKKIRNRVKKKRASEKMESATAESSSSKSGLLGVLGKSNIFGK